jgi:hypothetical protein
MDVNFTLRTMRASVARVLGGQFAADVETLSDALDTLASQAQSLDDWITRGGFMPDAWNRDEYNGWCNRETWACSLHLGNDEYIYNQARDAIRAHVRQSHENWSGEAGDFTLTAARSYAADGCKEYIDMLADPDGVRRTRDVVMMLGDIGSLWRVDWRAVSESLVDDDELGTLLTELQDAQ